jgi:SpoVK/Ycf46/Vps4 family AAA+-type ATPase
LASRLGKPLLTLDLATVISSFLGRTGANLRQVLDYAKGVDSVLLLDEFDAIAKRRGDETELGELKRLVTVLLQEIDLWPSDRLLVAATNHGELLDRAVWRRFDLVLDFPFPRQADLEQIIDRYFAEDIHALGPWRDRLVELCHDRSFSDIERLVSQIRRRAVVGSMTVEQAIVETVSTLWDRLPLAERKQLAVKLRQFGLPERKVSEITGLARDTFRKELKKKTSRIGNDHKQNRSAN